MPPEEGEGIVKANLNIDYLFFLSFLRGLVSSKHSVLHIESNTLAKRNAIGFRPYKRPKAGVKLRQRGGSSGEK